MVAPFPKPDTLVDPEFDLSQIHGACQIGESTKSGGGDDAHYFNRSDDLVPNGHRYGAVLRKQGG